MTASGSTQAMRAGRRERRRQWGRGALVVLLVALAAAPARAERLVAELSSRVVRITSNFNGVRLTLFGTAEDTLAAPPPGGYDLVVTVCGPRESAVAFRKVRRFGIWVNATSRTFGGVPSYLAVLSTRPLADVAPAATLRDERIGIDNVELRQETGEGVVADVDPHDPFRQAFVRLKRARRLYDESPEVKFLTPSLYRAGIFVPAEAPVGNYDVDVRLFAGGRAVARTRLAFEIRTVGFEHFIAGAAVNYGVLYGVATALMAVMTGWLASVLFRRD